MRFYLTFTKMAIPKPLIYEIGHKFKVVTNIRQATVSEELGLMAVEITGELSEINRATDYLKQHGVLVEPIEKNIIE